MKQSFRLMVFVLLSGVGLAGAQEEAWQVIRAQTEARLQAAIAPVQGLAGYAAVDLTTGERFEFRGDMVFPQGSAIKIPIMMEVFRQARAGKFQLSDRKWITKQDQVGGSGILSALGDRSSQLSIRDLVVLMILLSDNTATNILIELAGMANINTTMAGLGAGKTVVQRKMMDTAARGRGDENLSTPNEAARLLGLLYRSEFIDAAACEQILAILEQTAGGNIAAGVPDSVRVAFKPGGIPGVATEWAIVNLPSHPYVLVFMGNYGLADEFSQAMEQVSSILFDYFWRKSRATEYGTYVEPALLK